MSDNDFTSALNAAPEPASSGNTMGQSAVAGSVAGKDGQPARAQRDRSYAIDKLIEEDSKKFKKECKILLLGELRFPLARHLYPTRSDRVSVMNVVLQVRERVGSRLSSSR